MYPQLPAVAMSYLRGRSPYGFREEGCAREEKDKWTEWTRAMDRMDKGPQWTQMDDNGRAEERNPLQFS
jgi:hypothetical protein